MYGREEVIVPIWGVLEDRTIAMLVQDLITLTISMSNPVVAFHQGADPIEVDALSAKIKHTGIRVRDSIPMSQPLYAVWVYTSASNPATCPPELRCFNVRTRMLETPRAPIPIKSKPNLGKHGFEPIVPNDPMPPYRMNIPPSDAPAWMFYTQDEMNWMNQKP